LGHCKKYGRDDAQDNNTLTTYEEDSNGRNDNTFRTHSHPFNENGFSIPVIDEMKAVSSRYFPPSFWLL
jgi:hypothetical protein